VYVTRTVLLDAKETGCDNQKVSFCNSSQGIQAIVKLFLICIALSRHNIFIPVFTKFFAIMELHDSKASYH
jgi:hypothetical protein